MVGQSLQSTCVAGGWMLDYAGSESHGDLFIWAYDDKSSSAHRITNGGLYCNGHTIADTPSHWPNHRLWSRTCIWACHTQKNHCLEWCSSHITYNPRMLAADNRFRWFEGLAMGGHSAGLWPCGPTAGLAMGHGSIEVEAGCGGLMLASGFHGL